MSEFHDTVHYVGSYPEVVGVSPEETTYLTMDEMLSQAGPQLRTISDGETGSRQNWIVEHIDSYATNPSFFLEREGAWTSYEDCPEFSVAPGHNLVPADFNLHYAQYAAAARPAFDYLRAEYNRPDLALQVGIPSPFDMSLFTFGIERGMDPAMLEAYAVATQEQIAATHAEFGSDVVYQIETPASLSLALLNEELVPPAVLGENIAALAAAAPEDTRFGVHLCLGDLGNESRGQLANRDASVALANAIAASWPDGRTLDYIHEPIAAGTRPPILDKDAYHALGNLALPDGTRYIAGMVHESQSPAEQQRVCDIIRAELPENQALGFAAACGLGRRTLTVARTLSKRMIALAQA